MRIPKPDVFTGIMALFLLAACVSFSVCRPKKAGEEIQFSKLWRAPDIEERLAQYAPTDITIDDSLLNDAERKVLEKLVAAARPMNDIFWKQLDQDGLALRQALLDSTEPWARDFLRYLEINFGPYDILEGNKPFLGSTPRLPGVGFYPPDLTRRQFEDYVAAHPEVKDAFESGYTVIRRKDGELVAIPYSTEYRENLEPVAQALREAAELTTNPSLRDYLVQRADDLLSNDYYKSDVLWIELKDNLVETVIGPFEVYEDNLMGLKASYESFVYINDRQEMEKIKGYLGYLEEMQQNLPVEPEYKDQKVSGLASPLNVVFEVFVAGSARAGVQTSAFVLPNDEKVREEKGTKKVFLKNVMEAKFNKSLIPISERVLTPEDARLVTFFAYFNEVILHEISHALGLNYVTLPDGSRISVNKALREHGSAIEEAKADIVGLYNVPLLIERGYIPREKEPEIYATYLAGMFRSLRFGATEAHGLGTLVQFNYLREKEAFLYDPQTEKFRVNPEKVRPAVWDLAARFLVIEGKGSYEEAGLFLKKYGQMDEITRKTIQKLTDIPVDIQPVFQY
jgi:hypothetical protein